MNLLRGDSAFFFLFAAASSPDFHSDAFRAFCNACFRVRKFKPTLTVSALRTVLTVAAEERPLTIKWVARERRLEYHPIALQIGQLSDGRGMHRGLKLIRRVAGKDRREKLIVATKTGRALAHLFSRKTLNETTSCIERDWLKDRVNPALDKLLEAAPDMALGTFCVYLYATLHSDRFGHLGYPASTISRDLGISNLTVHLGTLAGRKSPRYSVNLLLLSKHPTDSRVTVPQPSNEGLALASEMAATLLAKEPGPVLRPKAERLLAAASPEELAIFEDDDFEAIDLTRSREPPDQTPRDRPI